jgi:hypothetical protein
MAKLLTKTHIYVDYKRECKRGEQYVTNAQVQVLETKPMTMKNADYNEGAEYARNFMRQHI